VASRLRFVAISFFKITVQPFHYLSDIRNRLERLHAAICAFDPAKGVLEKVV
jgi:hypothetical protein